MNTRTAASGFALLCLAATASPVLAQTLTETPMFAADVAAGKLPPVTDRVPADPQYLEVEPEAGSAPRQGGKLPVLLGSAKEIRQITVFGYARLVAYNERLELVPHILAGVDIRWDPLESTCRHASLSIL